MQRTRFNSTSLFNQKKNFRKVKTIPINLSTTVSMCLFLLIVEFSTLSAQVKVTGKLVHKDKSPIEFAEVILLNKDSIGILSELASEDGSFLLNTKQGVYTLQVRQFKTLFYTKQIDATTNLNLGTIEIENFSQELNAITIEVKDKLIERKVDRVIFNVENSLRAVGGDALEALSVTPGVRVQNDKLSMIGKSNLAVMVDDKLIQLSGDDLANFLKTIPAESIKSIEVISIPPSKYEADGNSGYVNIKLKKSRKNAWNTLINAAYLQRMYADGNTSANFNYNKKKLSLTASLFYRKGTFHANENNVSFFPDGRWNNQDPYNVSYQGISSKLGFDYQLSSKWTIGSQLMCNTHTVVLTNKTYTFVQDYVTENRIRYLQNTIVNQLHPLFNSANIYNEFKLDTTGKKITINLDYLNFSDNDQKPYKGISVIENPYSYKYFEGVNINARIINNFSAKLDLELPLKWINLSFGTKTSTSTAKNNITAFNSGIVDTPIQDYQLNKNKFEYTENVGALYISGSKKISKHWESQMGIRGEATYTKTYAENLNLTGKKNYIKLFPTAYLTYTINDNSTVTLRYSKRINRPRFNDLNPNKYFLNPFQTIEGNAFLQPSFSDNLELVHAFKRLESKLYVSIEKNLFSQIPINDPSSSTIRYTNENYIDSKKIGIAENFVFDQLGWWTSTNELDLNYSVATSNLSFATV